MSGHSKWHNIKNKKAAEDAKKGKIFGEVGRQIRVAVKEGGSGDPNFNPTLRVALEKAHMVNMPKVNIDRAIERGLGRTANGTIIEEVVYEGYGPAGVGILVYAVTDNRNRTGAEIRGLFERSGGALGGPGSAAYLFDSADGGKTVTVKIGLPVVDAAVQDKLKSFVDELENNDDVELVFTNMTV